MDIKGKVNIVDKSMSSYSFYFVITTFNFEKSQNTESLRIVTSISTYLPPIFTI